MNKTNFFVKSYNNINKTINNLLEKNLNKLNSKNFRNLSRNNIIILTFVALVVLFISYLLLPNFYNQSDISREIRNQLYNDYNLRFKFNQKLNYSFFPKPHFISSSATIIKKNQTQFSNIKKIKIYISSKNLFSFKNVKVNDLIIENANFNLNRKNYNFFIKLLDNNFQDKILKIKNSNIFFRNQNEEVLFINKILNLKYYYDENELKNNLRAESELFNVPFSIVSYKNIKKNKLFSKIKISFLKLLIENELNYNEHMYLGNSKIKFKKFKSNVKYTLKENLFEFNYYDKIENQKVFYEGKFNFKPFYSEISGKSDVLNLSYLFDTNAFIAQFLKTEILNDNKLEFKLNIKSKKILSNNNIINLNLNSKIKDGLIDSDNTEFEWRNFAKFKLNESLIYVKDGELVLDGKLEIDIKNRNELYKFLLTPKKYRKEIKKIGLNFIYNFDQKIADLKDINVDNKNNSELNKIFNKVEFKKNKFQNKIFFKNLLNKAIKSYSG